MDAQCDGRHVHYPASQNVESPDRVPDAVQRAAFRVLVLLNAIRRGALLIRDRHREIVSLAVPGLQRITPRHRSARTR
jgi:hypothetical protein